MPSSLQASTLLLAEKISQFKEALHEVLAIRPNHTVSEPKEEPAEPGPNGQMCQNVIVETCSYRLRFRFSAAVQDHRPVTMIKMDYAQLDGTLPPPDPDNPDVRINLQANHENTKSSMKMMAMITLAMDEPPSSQIQPGAPRPR